MSLNSNEMADESVEISEAEMSTQTKREPITIGVISRNGMPFIESCLASLPTQEDLGRPVHIMLVDSASTDQTTEVMKAFVNERHGATMFRMEGQSNAAAARNVLLHNVTAGFLLLLDGDFILNHTFLKEGIDQIKSGNADAIGGRIEETWHDGDCQPIQSEVVRDLFFEPGIRRTSGGSILLGPKAVSLGLQMDERFRQNEDTDFALRLTDDLKLLFIDQKIGVHLTKHYYSSARISEYYFQAYDVPLGRLIRKHIMHPDRIWAVRRYLRGAAIGVVIQVSLAAAIVTGQFGFILVAALAAGFDLSRLFKRGRLNSFIPTRLAAPWMILYGFLTPHETPPKYKVSRMDMTGPQGAAAE